jgi:hypothetical protein
MPSPEWMNTGRPAPSDWLGGGENVRGRDMTSLHHAAETFVGCLVMDGVLERHPGLKGAVVGLGAGWVPSMLARLDWATDIWKRAEPDLAARGSAASRIASPAAMRRRWTSSTPGISRGCSRTEGPPRCHPGLARSAETGTQGAAPGGEARRPNRASTSRP